MSDERSRGYSFYVLVLLAIGTVFNYYDRNLISILIEPMKRDLGLSDSQLGLLSGLAFAIVYCTVGIPIARYADRGRRVKVLGVSLGIWSVMTILCGFAQNYTALVAARLGVGLGEAGGLPTTHALVAEYVSPRRRATALSLIGLAGGLGLVLAMVIGGLISDLYGWRAAFWIGGAPGVLLAFIVYFTIKEPIIVKAEGPAAPPASFRADASMLLRRRSFTLFCIGLGIASIGAYGALTWTPAFLMRSFGLSAGEVGTTYSAATGPLTLLGIIVGGIVTDRLTRRDQRWALWVIAINFALMVPLSLAVYHAPSYFFALTAAAAAAFFATLYTGPAYALVQNLTGPRLRATGAAFLMVIANLVGLGLGPYFAGLLSDLLSPRFGADSLKWALSIGTVTYAVGTLLFLIASRSLKEDMAAAEHS